MLSDGHWVITLADVITISLGSHQNIGLHTGARADVVLLTYLLMLSDGHWVVTLADVER